MNLARLSQTLAACTIDGRDIPLIERHVLLRTLERLCEPASRQFADRRPRK